MPRKVPAPSGRVAQREIKFLQKSTKLLLRKKAFARLVREMTNKFKWQVQHQKTAMEALQEATEAYLLEMFQFANTSARHAKRETIQPQDIQLWLQVHKK
jgi:histone H3